VREPPVDLVALGRVVEAGLVGKHDRQQPVAVKVALAAQPARVRGERREPLAANAASPAAAGSHATASSGVWIEAVAASPRTRAVACSGAAARGT
jgi:hypothetical protein